MFMVRSFLLVPQVHITENILNFERSTRWGSRNGGEVLAFRDSVTEPIM
jgi:hypothetical protein